MKTIRIKHPTLDDGRIVEVPAQSWSHYAAAGWLLDEEPAEQPPEPSATPPAEAAPETLKRRSRTTKESD